MKGKKIIIISIIINIIIIGIIYNFIKKDYLNNEKIIVKAMTEGEYENNITSLNQSHKEYVDYIEESKTKIASAITDMGVTTSNDATLETMSNNIKSIARDASSISYDNSSSTLTSTNVQGAVDEINDSLGNLLYTKSFSITPKNISSTAIDNYVNVSVDGYTAIGVIGYYVGGAGYSGVNITTITLSSTNQLRIRMNGVSSDISIQVKILYIKN